MPKNWSDHEAEIRRLYMDEGRTLKDVRDIMSAKFDFNASIRAYRMRFDDLGWKKNKSVKTRRDQKTTSRNSRAETVFSTPEPMELVLPSEETGEDPQSSISDIDPVTQELFQGAFDITIPTGSKDAGEILSLIEGVPPAAGGLQVQLLKWQSGGAYLKASQKYILENHYRYDAQFSTFYRGSIFTMIEQKVGTGEQFLLAKMCLESDLDSRKLRTTRAMRGDTNSTSPSDDIPFLEKASESSSWSEAERTLYAVAMRSPQSKLLVGCSLVVVAEIFLKRYRDELDDLKRSSYIFDIHAEALIKDKRERLRRRYFDVLRSFEDSNMDVDLSFYKYAIRIAHWYQALSAREAENSSKLSTPAGDTQEETLESQRSDTPVDTTPSPQMDSVERTFGTVAPLLSQDVQITDYSGDMAPTDETGQSQTMHKPMQISSSSSSLFHYFSKKCQELIDDQETFANRHCQDINSPVESHPGFLPTSDSDGTKLDSVQDGTTSKCPPCEAMRRVYTLWKSKSTIVPHVHRLLELDGSETSFFCPPPEGIENMFDFVDQNIPQADKFSFTDELLQACVCFLEDRFRFKSPSFKWWLSLYTPDTSEDLQNALELRPIHLEKVMSAKGIKLLLTCSTMEAARGLLQDLQAKITDAQFSALQERLGESVTFDEASYLDDCRQFLDVFKILKTQDLKVEQSWYDFSVKMLQWELG
ncbi:hypothetical protein IFR05_009995 [Cadophora sp. M221]|nr:hypothetical protein IFR05_009995 [Cadophora sp. M221]